METTAVNFKAALMPWVCFTSNYDWQPKDARWMIAYKAGSVLLVKQVVAAQAIKAGKAKLVERPHNAAGRRSKVPNRLLQP